MACLSLTLPPLPSVPALKFSFSTPAFGLAANLCCHLNLPLVPPLNIGGIPILSAAIAAINAEIALIDAYIATLDFINLKCPLE